MFPIAFSSALEAPNANGRDATPDRSFAAKVFLWLKQFAIWVYLGVELVCWRLHLMARVTAQNADCQTATRCTLGCRGQQSFPEDHVADFGTFGTAKVVSATPLHVPELIHDTVFFGWRVLCFFKLSVDIFFNWGERCFCFHTWFHEWFLHQFVAPLCFKVLPVASVPWPWAHVSPSRDQLQCVPEGKKRATAGGLPLEM